MSTGVSNPYASPRTGPEPTGKAPPDDPIAWRRVRRGLGWSLVALLVGFGWGIFQIGIAATGGVTLLSQTWYSVLVGIVFVSSGLLTVVGRVECAMGARAAGAAHWAYAAAALAAVDLVWQLIRTVGGELLVGLSPRGIEVISLANSCIGILGIVCFVLFLRRVAMRVDRRGLRLHVTITLTLALIAGTLILAGASLVFWLTGGGGLLFSPTVPQWIVALGALVSIATLVLLAALLVRLRRAIPQ